MAPLCRPSHCRSARRVASQKSMTNAVAPPDRMPRRMLREFERWHFTPKAKRKTVIAEQARMTFRGAPHSSASCWNLPTDFPHEALCEWMMAVARQRWANATKRRAPT